MCVLCSFLQCKLRGDSSSSGGVYNLLQSKTRQYRCFHCLSLSLFLHVPPHLSSLPSFSFLLLLTHSVLLLSLTLLCPSLPPSPPTFLSRRFPWRFFPYLSHVFFAEMNYSMPDHRRDVLASTRFVYMYNPTKFSRNTSTRITAFFTMKILKSYIMHAYSVLGLRS